MGNGEIGNGEIGNSEVNRHRQYIRVIQEECNGPNRLYDNDSDETYTAVVTSPLGSAQA